MASPPNNTCDKCNGKKCHHTRRTALGDSSTSRPNVIDSLPGPSSASSPPPGSSSPSPGSSSSSPGSSSKLAVRTVKQINKGYRKKRGRRNRWYVAPEAWMTPEQIKQSRGKKPKKDTRVLRKSYNVTKTEMEVAETMQMLKYQSPRASQNATVEPPVQQSRPTNSESEVPQRVQQPQLAKAKGGPRQAQAPQSTNPKSKLPRMQVPRFLNPTREMRQVLQPRFPTIRIEMPRPMPQIAGYKITQCAGSLHCPICRAEARNRILELPSLIPIKRFTNPITESMSTPTSTASEVPATVPSTRSSNVIPITQEYRGSSNNTTNLIPMLPDYRSPPVVTNNLIRTLPQNRPATEVPINLMPTLPPPLISNQMPRLQEFNTAFRGLVPIKQEYNAFSAGAANIRHPLLEYRAPPNLIPIRSENRAIPNLTPTLQDFEAAFRGSSNLIPPTPNYTIPISMVSDYRTPCVSTTTTMSMEQYNAPPRGIVPEYRMVPIGQDYGASSEVATDLLSSVQDYSRPYGVTSTVDDYPTTANTAAAPPPEYGSINFDTPMSIQVMPEFNSSSGQDFSGSSMGVTNSITVKQECDTSVSTDNIDPTEQEYGPLYVDTNPMPMVEDYAQSSEPQEFGPPLLLTTVNDQSINDNCPYLSEPDMSTYPATSGTALDLAQTQGFDKESSSSEFSRQLTPTTSE